MSQIKPRILKLKQEGKIVDSTGVFHLYNGQHLYDLFKATLSLNYSKAAPFNEAMCVHPTSRNIFDNEFIQVRARGHQTEGQLYKKKVVLPLSDLESDKIEKIYLWFGEDLFCQINVLTVLAYLEQVDYRGKVILNSFKEPHLNITSQEIKLGSFCSIYHDLLIEHRMPDVKTYSLLQSSFSIYLELLNDHNRVTSFIDTHRNLTRNELVHELIKEFDYIGYGDLQYMELIDKTLN